jgi:hypothetical protein
MLIYARLDDPKVQGGVIGLLSSPGPEKGTCEGTGEDISYCPHPFHPVLAVAKDMDAARIAGWFERIQDERILPVTAEDKSLESPTPAIVVVKADTCSECGGPRRGRGYTHKEGCSLNSRASASKSNEVCSGCGGPRRGRGYTHKKGCRLDSRIILKQQQQQRQSNGETCPECGGTKRGRGFRHTEECSRSCKAT